ncbi:cytochrome c [Noviherbaspirillum aridicola]|uniref:Cytochrome c n=1 Tax=Noviherbaspirillum aridicola TaxID=2849687 RepID=A0ABQ4Q547_9BURK|nr:cytochrome c [Noviherbaspirillum aridicola]GIZ52319.1 cytochrome c [Noviherbaspirillum aridicola]
MRTWIKASLLLLLLAGIALAVVAWLGLREDAGSPPPPSPLPAAQMIERGAYLARAGNCMACHTERGGSPYAGGRAIRTPFGAIPAPNITPDRETGIGDWTADDFWRALHNGKGKDGRLLYPAFPYPNYTRVTRGDSDALYAYLRSLPAVRQASSEPDLRFPFNFRPLLAGWRALYFRAGEYRPEQSRDAQWNRGGYLVQGLGHCGACHTARNALGATDTGADLGGGMIPMLNWYASALTGEADGGLGDWDTQQLTDLLRNGVSARGAVSGPMAEVVAGSLQHLSEDDVRAMAVYLKTLPQGQTRSSPPPAAGPELDRVLRAGAGLYEKHCVDCHKSTGAGEPPHFPALAGNRAVLHVEPVNAIRAVLHGGYPPSTAGNPRPFGMPPFSAQLDDAEVATLVSYIRNSWGNRASLVGSDQVNRYRAVTLD